MADIRSYWKKRTFSSKMRLILGVFGVILVAIFIYLKVVPFGRITYTRTWPRGLASGKGFIYDFKPGERIDTASSSALRIVAEPVYFSLYAPRAFDSAEVTVKYRDRLASSTPIIEIGILSDRLTGRYRLAPLQNDIVDRYRFSWPRLEDKQGRLILQAEKHYDSPAEFDKDLASGNLYGCPSGPISCIATYNYPLDTDFQLPDYSSVSPTVIDQPLRGALQFYFYSKSPSWRLAFKFVDLNLDAADDPIAIEVYKGKELADAKDLSDSRSAVGGKTEEKDATLSGQGGPGLYRVEVKASDDIVMSKLTSTSDKISFINKVWPVSGKGKLTLYTDASYVGASTVNPASLGKISFGGRDFDLDKTYKQFSFRNAEGVNKIVLKNDDIILENSGVFSFSESGLIDPAARKIDRYFSPSDRIRYIIADYERPLEDGGLKTARATLDMKGAASEDGKYTFLISIPGLDGAAGAEEYLEIEEISLKLSGKTIFKKIREIISN